MDVLGHGLPEGELAHLTRPRAGRTAWRVCPAEGRCPCGAAVRAGPGGPWRRNHRGHHRLAEGPSIAYRYMKENLNRAVTGDLGECMDLEVTHHVHTGLTDDHHEAARAFAEKREPRFQGR
jgi:hypothetical protein